MHIVIWPSSGIKTLRDTRSAVGRFRDNTGFGLVHPTGEQSQYKIHPVVDILDPAKTLTKNCYR